VLVRLGPPADRRVAARASAAPEARGLVARVLVDSGRAGQLAIVRLARGMTVPDRAEVGQAGRVQAKLVPPGVVRLGVVQADRGVPPVIGMTAAGMIALAVIVRRVRGTTAVAVIVRRVRGTAVVGVIVRRALGRIVLDQADLVRLGVAQADRGVLSAIGMIGAGMIAAEMIGVGTIVLAVTVRRVRGTTAVGVIVRRVRGTTVPDQVRHVQAGHVQAELVPPGVAQADRAVLSATGMIAAGMIGAGMIGAEMIAAGMIGVAAIGRRVRGRVETARRSKKLPSVPPGRYHVGPMEPSVDRSVVRSVDQWNDAQVEWSREPRNWVRPENLRTVGASARSGSMRDRCAVPRLAQPVGVGSRPNRPSPFGVRRRLHNPSRVCPPRVRARCSNASKRLREPWIGSGSAMHVAW